MTFRLDWLAKTLRDAGLKVVEQPGWQTRGRGDMSTVKGVMLHHTAAGKNGNAPSLMIVQNGRPDLAGPLAHLVLGRDGTYFVCAAGAANHAGKGDWKGSTSGNTQFIGIEAENTGLANDMPWPEPQMDAYRRGVVAMLKKIGAQPIMAVGHKEYALPKGRKIDPTFDMNKFRKDITAMMGAVSPAARQTPALETPTEETFTVSTVISDQTLSKAIQIESSGNPLAKAPNTSATGLGQFLSKTWLGVVRKHRPDWLKSHSEREVLDLRNDPDASIEMLARFWEDNAKSLGRGYTEGDLYLAHFLGLGDARNVFRAPPGDHIEKHIQPTSVEHNPTILRGKLVSQVRSWASAKMAASGKTNWVERHWTGDSTFAEDPDTETPLAEPSGVEDIPEEEEPVKAEVDAEVEEDEELHGASGGAEIAAIQQRLINRGYYEIGFVDSIIDSRVIGAMAGFRKDRGLPPPWEGGEIDDILKAELFQAEAEGWKRPISATRAATSEVTVTERAPEAAPVKQSKFTAFWAGISAAVVAAINFVSDNFKESLSYIIEVKDYLNLIPGWMWLLATAGGLFYFYRQSKRSVEEITEAVREGKRN